MPLPLFSSPHYFVSVCRRLWDSGSGRCLKTLVDNDNPPVTSVKFSPNGKYILAGSLDNAVRLWAHQTGKCVKTYLGHQNVKYCCYPNFVSRKGDDSIDYEASSSVINLITSGSEDGKVYVWDMNSKGLLASHKAFDGPVLALGISPDGDHLAVASLEPELTINIFRLLVK